MASMSNPTLSSLETRIRILERHVETLERAAKVTRRHSSASGILPADGGLRNSEAARERGIAEAILTMTKLEILDEYLLAA
jgi:hypothetical protein